MKLSPLPQIIVFILSLAFGRLLTVQFATDQTIADFHRAEQPLIDQVNYSQIPVDQINFLIIKVDSLKADQPELENLWWVLHKHQNSINLVSIFPSLKNNEEAETLLRSTFGVELSAGKYRLNQAFEELLASWNLSWQGYLILDEIAFRSVLGDQPIPTLGNKAPLPHPESATQLLEWKLFCRKNLQAAWQDSAQYPWFWEFDQEHLSFGDTEQSIEIWQTLLSGASTNTCVFPILDSQSDQ
jgi:hypothetical protein